MLARLQRRVLALIAVLAALAFGGLWAAGQPLWAVLAALAVALGYTLVLAVEFGLLAWTHRDDPAPRAGPLELLRAWWGECVIAARVFGWRQPFRASALPDVPGRPGVRGVVFVHGYLCNRGFWNPWLARCAAEGRPCIAINLEPVFSPLEAYLAAVEAAVARLERETGLPPLLVCHSMGGLVARAWLASTPGADARVQHVITIGTPHRGTWLARLGRTANALHMRQASDWLGALAQREPAERAARFTCFYGHADNIVFPPCAALLQGATGHHLRATAHVAMAFHPAVFNEVAGWLARTESPPSSGSARRAEPA